MKKFLIIGSGNAMIYKEIFPLFKENKIWVGVNKNMSFIDVNNGIKNILCCWFTNLGKNLHAPINLYKHYNANEYPKYYNYDAINVNRTPDIPIDYYDYIGVPITFLYKYCPEQFEIIGLGIANLGLSIGVKPYKLEHKKYRKEVQKRGAVDGDLYLMDGDEIKCPYARMLIRLKK